MRRIRVLVVDDAVVVRRLVSEVISADPALEVAGTAPNGRIALAKLGQVSPDVVVLDVEMPEMDGIETLAALRKTHPKLPVIMFSTLTERGGAATLDALALGATDYVTKPANVGSVADAMERVRRELIPKLKQFCRRPGDEPAAPRRPIPPGAGRRAGGGGRVDAVAIGVSTGGPNALAVVVPRLPADLGVPVFVVQHMPPVFTRLLADRLAAISRLAVGEGADGALVEPGRVWVAPGDHHMTAAREGAAVRLRVHRGPPENSCRPAVDTLLRSVVEVYGAGTLAVVMTGMGHDGLRGCEAVREAGGQVLAQDEATSVVWGMPGAVVQAGLADAVLPLDRLASEVTSRVRGGRCAGAVA